MSNDLTAWVNIRLDADEKTQDDAKLLVLAALEGKTSLADMAGHAAPDRAPDVIEEIEPVGAFLKRIKVRGFRGIGPHSQLDLDPSPSLTVISGRNGSGKSSFAEALEVALTGTTYRWHARTTQWKEQWRNIHDGDAPRIDVTLAEQDVGPTTLTVEWPCDADLDSMEISLQRQGEKKQAGTSSLGWDGPLSTFRPMLTYEELGALLTAEPKVLYDAISTVLGLEQLTDAIRALDEHRKKLGAPDTALRNDKKSLLQALEGLEDDRAALATKLISAKTPNNNELRHLAAGTSIDTGLGNRLRAILALEFPTEERCEDAATALRAAVGRLADVGGRVGDALHRRDQLISAAINVHEHEGDQACPVCNTGTLDADRISFLRSALAEDKQQLADFNSARTRHAAALSDAHSLTSAPPAPLTADLPASLADLAQSTNTSWQTWATSPTDPLGLSDHLTAFSTPVREALGRLRAAASSYINELDESWSKVASRLAAYAEAVEVWEATKPEASAATTAHKWLKDNAIDLRNERLKPIADEAKKIWADLRHASNVEIAGLTLESSNTRRHVSIAAEVDGQDAGALAVMSQGELHSLALALFLPRATMPDSPFRFVVLDDPVQAMDPAKVDGLVKVLVDIAKTRQVIVFSHDDRFASAVRRAPKGVQVKVLEVVREANSKVTPIVTYSPADRYLKDAFGLTKDSGLPDDTRRRILPGLLRMALEAQAREVYFDRELSKGASHHAAEKAWEDAEKTRSRLALAIGDPSKIDAWLTKAPYRKRALHSANSIHTGLKRDDPIDACRDVEKTLIDIKNGVR